MMSHHRPSLTEVNHRIAHYFTACPSLARLAAGRTLYIIGGTTRELFLGREPHDLDILIGPAGVAEDEKAITTLLEDLGAYRIKETPLVYRLDCATITVDLLPFAGRDVESNLRARDFTINAMALVIRSGTVTQVLDPTGGMTDLAARRLRAVTKSALVNDAIRILRGYRLAAELGFKVDELTRRWMVQSSPGLATAAPENILKELLACCAAPHFQSVFPLMVSDGLWFNLMPELIPLKGCHQGGYHHLDVWGHTVATVMYLATALQKGPSSPLAQLADLDTRPFAMGHTTTPFLVFAALFHDLGKPRTMTIRPDGRRLFKGHDRCGAVMVRPILDRFRFSHKAAAFITRLVERHLRPLWIARRYTCDRQVITAWLREFQDDTPWLVALALADQAAKAGPALEPGRLNRFEHLAASALAQYTAHGPPPFPLSGNVLITYLGVTPGPGLGRLLARLRREWNSGRWTTPTEGLARARQLVKSGFLAPPPA